MQQIPERHKINFWLQKGVRVVRRDWKAGSRQV